MQLTNLPASNTEVNSEWNYARGLYGDTLGLRV